MNGTLKQFKHHICSLDEVSQKQVDLFGSKIIRIARVQKQFQSEAFVPPGFALSTELYWDLLNSNDIRKKIKALIADIDVSDTELLKKQSQKVRKLIGNAKWTTLQKQYIVAQYQEVFGLKNQPLCLVRSSAVAQNVNQEEFPQLHDTVFSVKNPKQLLEAIKHCYASLFSEKALFYRHQKGLGHMHVAMATLIQQQFTPVISGIVYPADLTSGFSQVLTVEASYGTHQLLQQGDIQPDRFTIFKPAILQEKQSIISRSLGSKQTQKYIQKTGKLISKKTAKPQTQQFCISEKKLFDLAVLHQKIQKSASDLYSLYWSIDTTGAIVISQISVYTKIHRGKQSFERYTLKKESTVLAKGSAIGKGIVVGRPVVVNNPQEKNNFKSGDILVAKHTDVRFNSLIKQAAAIIVEQGSTSSHSAVMARELGILCLVEVKQAREICTRKKQITIDSSKGAQEATVYSGALPYEIHKTDLVHVPKTKTQLLMQLSDPKHAYVLSNLPHDGIGVLESAYLFSTTFSAHPMAFLEPKKFCDQKGKKQIRQKALGYGSLKEYAITAMAESIAVVAAAAYPKPVQLQIAAESSELEPLLGGSDFEPILSEQGLVLEKAERILSKTYRPVLALECAAIKKVREEWGLQNVHIVLPECRSPQEGKQVLERLQELGLERKKNGLNIQVCCDIPSNVMFVQDFVKHFDGLHVSTNHLSIFSQVKNPQAILSDGQKTVLDAELKSIVKKVIKAARKKRKPVNIYGQAASDSEVFRDFLVQQGVQSLSLSPDKLIESKQRVAALEKTVGRYGNQRTHYSSLFALSLFAVFGSLLMTVGVGCTGPNAEVHNEASYVSPAELRIQAEKRQQERMDQQREEERSLLEIEDFAQFSIQYPSGWKVRYWNDGVTVQDPETKQYLSIYKKLVNPYVAQGQKESIVISGMPGLRMDIANQPLPLSVIELQTPQYIDDEGNPLNQTGQQLLIEGSTEIVNRFLETFQFGTSSDAILGRDLNQWDQKDGRFCAQVITYARQNEGDECTLFSSPCAIPKNWQICEGE